jgi:pimeloyl-ACP methyl ester carboxylesterase
MMPTSFMINAFDPRYESPDHCEIIHKCRDKKCGSDVYILPGWDGSVPIVHGKLGMRFDSYVKEYFDNHDVYSCRNLPYYKNEHDIDEISRVMFDQIQAHSGQEKVVLIGNCFGGMVAQQVAADNPEKIKGMVLSFSLDSVPMYQDIAKGAGIQDSDMEYLLGMFLGSRTGQLLMDVFSDNEDLETVDGLMQYWRYDGKEVSEKIEVPTYVFNCTTDAVLGRFPDIKNAEREVDPFCFHHRIRPDNVESMAAFIDDL